MRPAATALLLAVLLPLPGLAGEVVVKPGETLSELAERYGTTSERLMQLNGLRSPQDLWAGSRIRVPGPGGGSGGAGGVSRNGNYTVKPGETLSEIAERHGTTSERLMQLNGLRSGKDLWAGSRIQVPGASPTRSVTTKPPLNRNARQHDVQPGETLSEIADRYGIPMSRLVALNGLARPDDLQAGSTLKLRGTPPAGKPPVRAASRSAAVASRPVASKLNSKPAEASPAARPAANSTSTAATRPGTAATTTAGTTMATDAITTSPTPRPTATTKPGPAATAVANAKPSKPATPDWRSYGPLQVDWANWQPMAGSFVAPSLNGDGQPLYLAVNCTARRLNATGQSGTWKTWDAPQSDFEEQLISDLCKAKGS